MKMSFNVYKYYNLDIKIWITAPKATFSWLVLLGASNYVKGWLEGFYEVIVIGLLFVRNNMCI